MAYVRQHRQQLRKAETWNHSFGGDPVASIRELDLEVLQQLQSIGGYAKHTEMTVT